MTFVTRRHIPRRSFLRGAGAAIALPFLDAMVPAFARAADTRTPVRMAFLYVPNGIVMKDWTPAMEGSNFEFPRILKARRTVSRRSAGADRPGSSPGGGNGRGSCTGGRYVPDGSLSEEDDQRRCRSRHFGRPGRRAGDRGENAFAVSRTGVRSIAHRRQLRLRVQLRLHQQHVVERALHSESTRDKSASGFRTAFWNSRREQRPPGPRRD